MIDPVTRGWAVVTSAGVVRLGFGFVASLVIARALGPTAFGVYAVLGASVAIVNTLAEGGLTEAAVLRLSRVWALDQQMAEQGARAFFWLRLGLASAVVALGCGAAQIVASQLLNGLDDGLLRWAFLGVVATAASGATSAMLQATGAFGRMSSLTLINTGLTAALALVLAITHTLDLLSALIILGIGTSVASFVAGLAMLPHGWRLAMPTVDALKKEAEKLFLTGRWLWVASLFAVVTANAEVLLLNRWAALPLIGAYALALNLATRANIVNDSLYTVLLPSVSNLDQDTRLRSYTRRGLVRSGAIALGLLLLIPLAEPFIVLVYGPAFAQAAVFFRLLIGVIIFDVMVTPFLLLPLAYGRPKMLAAADGVRAITLVLVALGLVPLYGAFGAITARLAARVGGAVVVFVYLRRGPTTEGERTHAHLADRIGLHVEPASEADRLR